MTLGLQALCFAAREPDELAGFWAALLGLHRDGLDLLATDDMTFGLRFVRSDAPKTQQNQAHFDLTSTSPEDQQRTVARAIELGGRHIDIGQQPDDPHVVMADPEGNEFCVIEPENSFLADCGFVGALACDGSQAVGYFWHDALGWPLVWDEGEETAIRSPDGGPKITWGGPPFAAKVGTNRLHLDLVATDPATEAERLVALGALRAQPTHDVPGALALVDPDGNEFCVGSFSDE